MGGANSSRRESLDLQGDVNFDHFQILRAIGKGSFGKVCIVQKKDTKKMYAMKYMNKMMCIKKDAVRNVFREIEILTDLEHPFLVNLWFTFQDEEDMFMVVDLLLGGDLRYHIQQEVQFDEYQVRLYVCEIALALDYLQQNNIIHRDIKPDNILLDEEGHVHITDFNIATVLSDGQLATSMSGTTPYMAPEVFACALDECPGYSYPVDWWSLGICAYEMLKDRRPYDIHAGSSILEIKQIFMTCKVHYSISMHEGVKDLIKQLLTLDPDRRISSLTALKRQYFMNELDFDKVLHRQIKPTFEPSRDHLNCDPTYELEEMIIESKPLHKKKKRLAKQNSKRGELSRQASVVSDSDNTVEEENIYKYFKIYNREKVKYQAEQKQVEETEEESPTTEKVSEVKKPSLRGMQVNESFDCEDENHLSFDRPNTQRLSVHSAIDVGGPRHSGKTVTFCDRRLSDYTCYSRKDRNQLTELTGIIKPTLKDRRLSDMSNQKSPQLDRSHSIDNDDGSEISHFIDVGRNVESSHCHSVEKSDENSHFINTGRTVRSHSHSIENRHGNDDSHIIGSSRKERSHSHSIENSHGTNNSHHFGASHSVDIHNINVSKPPDITYDTEDDGLTGTS